MITPLDTQDAHALLGDSTTEYVNTTCTCTANYSQHHFFPFGLISCNYRCFTAQRAFKGLSRPHCFSFLFQQIEN